MVKLTPMLLVDAIEPCLPFWVDRLGFQITEDSSTSGRLDAVTLQKGGVEIAYQTRAARSRDVPVLREGAIPGSTILYCEVENLEEYEQKLEGIETIVPVRETSYGGAELFVREPAGNIIVFCAKAGY
jgi:hypothetical protein